jgi:uncharacterized UBP type Zn finger protein
MLFETHGGHSPSSACEVLDENDFQVVGENGKFDESELARLNKVYWPFLEQKCKLCRDQSNFEQSQRDSGESPATKKESPLSCSECDNKQNLWICLICAYVGCGRYFKRHAVDHFD